jgi:hypothetical protein
MMKNITSIKKGALLAGLLTFFIVSSIAQDVTTYAYAFTKEPKIDGYIDKEWDENEFLQISHELAGENRATEEDFSGSFKISWYNNDLYFLFVVTDDTLILNEGQQIWLGDNINLYLDLGNEKNLTYDNNDYLCHFKWGNSDYFERYNGDNLIQIDNSKTAIEFAQTCDTIKHLLIMEIAIRNIAELNGPSILDESTAIGLDAGIYDCDEGDPCFYTHQLSWIDTTGYAWSNPSKLGTVSFGTVMLKAAKTLNTLYRSDVASLVKIYPTIVSNSLNIQTSLTDDLDVEIINILGNKIESIVLRSGNSVIDVSSLNSGLYFVNVYDSKELISSQKIIVDR